MKDKRAAPKDKLAAAREYALKFISYRPRSAWEIKRKLSDRGFDSETIALVLVFLREYSFVDDEEFTRMWIRNRTKEKPCGLLRIKSELISKGIDRDIVERCLAELPPERDEELAAGLALKKCRRTGFNYKKLKGFLLRRGFHASTVERVLAFYTAKFKELSE